MQQTLSFEDALNVIAQIQRHPGLKLNLEEHLLLGKALETVATEYQALKDKYEPQLDTTE